MDWSFMATFTGCAFVSLLQCIGVHQGPGHLKLLYFKWLLAIAVFH